MNRSLLAGRSSLANKALYAAMLFVSPVAMAQALPDAGSLRQQIEQKRELNLPQAVRPERPAPPAESKALVGITLQVKEFRIIGNELLSTEQLIPALADFKDRELDFAGLQRAADAVAASYREAGWIARVYLPEQDISSGVITLQVVEARYAGLQFEGAQPTQVTRAEIEQWFKTHQAEGAFLNASALDRALLLVDDLPGVSVAGTLAPGTADGETALVLQTTDETFIYGDIGLDNTGARSTGSQRLSANMNINSPGGRGELLSISLLHTQGSDYSRIGFTVPAGYNGLRLGVNTSAMRYRVIGGPSSITSLQIEGHSDSVGLEWSYPMVRTRLHNLYFSGGLDNKTFQSYSKNTDTSDPKSYSNYESDSLRLGFSANSFDNLGGGGASSASVQVLKGRLANIQAHNLLGTIEPDYKKLNYSLSRQQALTANHSLLVTLSGQHATQVLDSSEKFYIGGAQTVRAYPLSELGGERGHTMSSEWRWRLDTAWMLSAFVDYGRVVSLPTSSSETTTALTLQGHGLSVGWQGPMGISSKLTWAYRNGHNPKATSTATDGDGTLRMDRFWFTTSIVF